MNTRTLEKQARRLSDKLQPRPLDQAPVSLEDLTSEQRAGLEAFSGRMRALGKITDQGPGRTPRLELAQLTDDELDQAEYWSNLLYSKQGGRKQ